MLRTTRFSLLTVLVLFAGSALSLQADPYLKIHGIPSDYTHNGEKGWIDARSNQFHPRPFTLSMTHDSDGNKISEFVVTKEVDETSIPISLALLRGTVIEEITCVVYQVGMGTMKWTFEDVMIKSIRLISQDDTYGVTALEEIRFTFKRVKWDYGDGYPPEKVVGGWDIESDAEIPLPTGVDGFTAHQ